MKKEKLEKILKEWLSPKDMSALDETVKYLEELGEKAKNISTVDEAYDFATQDLGMECTKEEFQKGAETLEYISDQIKQKTDEAKKAAENAYLDAVAVYMTAEKRLKAAEAEYTKYTDELKAEFNENRAHAPEYAENAARKLEEDARNFYEDVKQSLKSKDVEEYIEYIKNMEALGRRLAKAKSTKEAYEIATDLGLDCPWSDFKKAAKTLGMYYKDKD